ncbi:MAG: hypothetical protein OK439_04105 [Thaumarchaeota archaeon]|nr:hypothetical protein [Nitrososphaerota archaeon]
MRSGNGLIFASARISFLAVVGVIFLGGICDWAYINSQESSIPLANAFVEYLTSYASAFVIAGIEISAAYYFVKKYDLGKTKKLLELSLSAGTIGFVVYIIGEAAAGLLSVGNTSASVLQVIYSEISPYDLDYGNALVIFLSIFSLVLLVGLLLKINPARYQKTGLTNGTGFIGGLWTSTITTFAAMVCCGPLPAAIAVFTGISPLLFTDIINLQSLLVLVSVPPLLYAVILADRRARNGCRLR